MTGLELDLRLRFDRAIRDDPNLRGPTKAVAWALSSRADEDGTCWPSIAKLMVDSGYGRRTVFYALKDLADSGWLKRRRTGRSSVNTLAIPAHQMCNSCTTEVQSVHLRSATDAPEVDREDDQVEQQQEVEVLERARTRDDDKPAAAEPESIGSVIDRALQAAKRGEPQ